jgi:SOS-response transcriptional repressor LexA
MERQMELLTHRQRGIYDFIKDKIESRGYGPTVREIADAFHIQSPNGVLLHLNTLVTKGFRVRQGKSARAIRLYEETEYEKTESDRCEQCDRLRSENKALQEDNAKLKDEARVREDFITTLMNFDEQIR